MDVAEQAPVVNRSMYAGVFMVALATLMYEILLTRIFSVTMWYHFAFVAISVAMFGMTVGALAVFLWPLVFTPARARLLMARSAVSLPWALAGSFLTMPSSPSRSSSAGSASAWR
jgi:hypothetical protein